MIIDRLEWHYHRLRAMSAEEIGHRGLEFGKRSIDGRRRFEFRGDAGPLPTIPGLRDRVKNAPPLARESFRAIAAKVREGRYKLLGLEWPTMVSEPNWHLDPVSAATWPENKFCFAIPFRSNREFGDVKFVWELNRLQHLQCVAAAAACDDDASLADICVSQIRSWISANPPFQGVNWTSGIELSLRVVSLLVTASLLPEGAFSDADRIAIDSTLQAHQYWIARYPSRYSSANNHLVGEAASLFILGVLSPERSRSKRCTAYGRRVLNEEALRQILPDGVPAEQSPTYGAFTAEWMLVAHTVALAAQQPGLSQQTLERLKSFLHFVKAITDCSANVPRIGDDDEGRVIAGDGNSNEYLASMCRAIAAVTGCPVSDGQHTKEALRSVVVPTTAIETGCSSQTVTGVDLFRDGGYSVLRDYIGSRECLLVFDHGPLGYLSIAAHGHADALSIWLHVDGREVLVDAGTYLYHSGGSWRTHFRGTAAHNTLLVAERDQSVPAGDFNWSTKANSRLTSLSPTVEQFQVTAEHDGYSKQFGIVHRRSILRAASGQYIVEDTLVCGRARRVPAQIGFLIAANLTFRELEHGWSIANSERVLLTIECRSATHRYVEQGTTGSKIRGWMSPTFGHKVIATRLVADFPAGTDTMTTVLTVPSY